MVLGLPQRSRLVAHLTARVEELTAARARLMERQGLLATAWPPYCCCLLVDRRDGTMLVEDRGAGAAVATNKLTCFGGKRHLGEEPAACLLRECQEELGWVPRGPARAVDLFVDGKLIAYFYQADAPSRTVPLRFEEARGRAGVWIQGLDPRLSPWHACVIEAWRSGQSRADFVSECDADRLRS
jgi:8-oxo-dGTP pyrophosphatase MutT (NUDIX family)